MNEDRLATRQALSERLPRSRGALLLLALVLAYIVSFTDRQILALLAPQVKADLGLSDLEVGLLQGLAFSLLFCLAGLPLGWVVDNANRKRLIVAGILFWSVMTALCGLANSFFLLFIARMGVGVGEAVLAPAAYSMIADAFRPERVTMAMAIFTTAGIMGAGLAFLGSGAAIEAITSMPALPMGLMPWQATFVFVGVTGILVLLLFWPVVEPERKDHGGEKPAIAGTLSMLVRRRRDYAPLYICCLLLSTISHAGFIWIPAHLIRFHHIPASSAGLLLGTIYLMCAMLGALSGAKLTETFQRRGYSAAPLRTVLVVSLILIPASFTAIVSNENAMLVLLVLLAFGQSSFYGIIVAALQLITPPRMRGVSSSIFILVTNLGSLGIGSAIIGFMSDMLSANLANGLGISIGIVSLSCAVLSAFMAWNGLRRFAEVMNAASHPVVH